MLHQVTPSVSSFSTCLKLFPKFLQFYIGPSDVLRLEVFGICPSKKPIYLFFPIFRSYTQ